MLEVNMAHSQLLKGRLYIDLEVADSCPLAAVFPFPPLSLPCVGL